MDRTEFNAEYERLLESHGKKNTSAMTEAYWDALRWYDLSDFQQAVKRSIQEDDRFPKVPRLVGFIKETGGQKANHIGYVTFVCSNCKDGFALPTRMKRAGLLLEGQKLSLQDNGMIQHEGITEECSRQFSVGELRDKFSAQQHLSPGSREHIYV